jgi:hypothetical protein
LRQLAEKPTRLLPPAQVCAVDADDDLLQVTDVLELAGDEPERGGPHFPDMTGQHQGDRRFLDELPDLALQPAEIRRAEPVQSGDGASLEKIRHIEWPASRSRAGGDQPAGPAWTRSKENASFTSDKPLHLLGKKFIPRLAPT